MGLKDLIISQEKVTEGLLESILRDNIDLVEQDSSVHLTVKSFRYSAKLKILLYLSGKKAWAEINNSELQLVSITEFEKSLSIVNATVRSQLHILGKDNLVYSNKSNYGITTKGILQISEILQD